MLEAFDHAFVFGDFELVLFDVLSFLGFYLHDFVVGVGRKKCRVGGTDGNSVLLLAGHLVVVLPLLKHQSCFLLEQVVVLDSSLI